jgi:hypothetical protein
MFFINQNCSWNFRHIPMMALFIDANNRIETSHSDVLSRD